MTRAKGDAYFTGSIEGAVQVLVSRGWTRERIVGVVDDALAEAAEAGAGAR